MAYKVLRTECPDYGGARVFLDSGHSLRFTHGEVTEKRIEETMAIVVADEAREAKEAAIDEALDAELQNRKESVAYDTMTPEQAKEAVFPTAVAREL